MSPIACFPIHTRIDCPCSSYIHLVIIIICTFIFVVPIALIQVMPCFPAPIPPVFRRTHGSVQSHPPHCYRLRTLSVPYRTLTLLNDASQRRGTGTVPPSWSSPSAPLGGTLLEDRGLLLRGAVRGVPVQALQVSPAERERRGADSQPGRKGLHRRKE